MSASRPISNDPSAVFARCAAETAAPARARIQPDQTSPWQCLVFVGALAVFAGCARDLPTESMRGPGAPLADLAESRHPALAATVRQLAAARGVSVLASPAPVRAPLVRLGQLLAFDKILSGNRDISCMTCHLPSLGTGDGRSLSIGQGATGLGQDRVHPLGEFIPRNAPPLFNLHALSSLFWDGRVAVDGQGNFHTPAGAQVTGEMSRVFEFGSASALGLFPVLSREEMRARSGNELAAIADEDRPAIWQGLMVRLGAIREYRQLFESAYPGTAFDDMTFAHASNAIAGFLLSEMTFNQSPWDGFLQGNDNSLTGAQLKGAETFLTIRCSLCHTGAALTDNQFHNVAVAQLGPGQGDGTSGRDDFGRMRVTGDPADQYRFRTTALRNVTLTGPYGHDGAIAGLREFIEHYSESHIKLRTFDPLTLEPPLRGTLLPTAEAILATRDTILDGVVLPSDVVDQLMDFMEALTDPRAKNLGQRVTPPRVPSGLRVDGATRYP